MEPAKTNRHDLGKVYHRSESLFDRLLLKNPEEAVTNIDGFCSNYYVAQQDSLPMSRHLAKRALRAPISENARCLAYHQLGWTYYRLTGREATFNQRHHVSAIRYYDKALASGRPPWQCILERAELYVSLAYYSEPRSASTYRQAVTACVEAIDKADYSAVDTHLLRLVDICPDDELSRSLLCNELAPRLSQLVVCEDPKNSGGGELICQQFVDLVGARGWSVRRCV